MFNIGDKLTKENYTQGAIWAKKNNLTIVKRGSDYFIDEIEIPVLTKEEVEQKRAELYRSQVDPLMSEYNRKKLFNLFESGEENALLQTIVNKVDEIRTSNPYPEVKDPLPDGNPD